MTFFLFLFRQNEFRRKYKWFPYQRATLFTDFYTVEEIGFLTTITQYSAVLKDDDTQFSGQSRQIKLTLTDPTPHAIIISK